MGHVLAALRELDERGARAIEVRRRRRRRVRRELRRPLAAHGLALGLQNWYVDEHGIDPNQWPWTLLVYRRRTAQLDPDAYALT